MTNETAPHENGAADAGQEILATTIPAAAETESSPTAEQLTDAPTGDAAAAPPAEPAPPSFDDLGLHPDIRLALVDMGYFSPTPVQTAVYKPVTEGKDLLVQSKTGTGK